MGAIASPIRFIISYFLIDRDVPNGKVEQRQMTSNSVSEAFCCPLQRSVSLRSDFTASLIEVKQHLNSQQASQYLHSFLYQRENKNSGRLSVQ